MDPSALNESDMGERRNLFSSFRCSRSMAFRNERRHLVILSVLAGVVFFGCGLLGGTAPSRYSTAPPSNTGSFSASTAAQSGSGLEEQGQDGPDMNLAATIGAVGETSSGETTELKVRIYNAYTANNPIELYPWEHMAEPYKPSTMEVVGWPSSGENLEYR